SGCFDRAGWRGADWASHVPAGTLAFDLPMGSAASNASGSPRPRRALRGDRSYNQHNEQHGMPQRSRRAVMAGAETPRRIPDEIGRRTFDLIVVGAGVNGAGIARDAAMRGLSVLLIEKEDIGSGTTDSSTRLIHGGLRYLE